MTRSSPHLAPRRLRLGAALAGLLSAAALQAAPVVITTPYMNLENRAVNSLGFGTGQFLRFGANAVVPNGLNGTTGVATQVGTGQTRAMNFSSSPLLPNQFSRFLIDDPALRGSWDLKFTNNTGGTTDTATVRVSLDAAATQVKFVDTITLSGTSLNPTFTWAPPAGTLVNGYRVNIFDKSLITPTDSGQVASRNLQPGVTSFTVTPSVFTVPGYGFQQGKNYSIEISIIQTRDGLSTNLGNDNLKAISRVYADFTPNTGGGPPVNLPVVLDNGAYQFNMAVVPGQVYYIDPMVAVGYDYATGAGDPNFASVDLPDGIGDGQYDIFGFDGSGNPVQLAHDWNGASVFTFAPGGVSRFRVTGIETSANLDPSSTTAFVTGLTFAGAGKFTGTQTPLTVDVTVPEPSTLALLGIAAVAARGARRRPGAGRVTAS